MDVNIYGTDGTVRSMDRTDSCMDGTKFSMDGTVRSMVTTWTTFLPAFIFIFIFLGAPYIESLRGKKMFDRALSGITAAVLGVFLILHSYME